MMGSSRFPAVTGLVAAAILFLGCLGVLINGSTGHRLDALQPMSDTHRVNNFIPNFSAKPVHALTPEVERHVQLAQVTR